MKYGEQLNKVVLHLPTLINALGISELKLEDYSIRILHDLHFQLYVNLTYPAENPNVLNKEGKRLIECGGDRLLELDQDFELYPNNCIDDNITTAMRKAIKSILKPVA